MNDNEFKRDYLSLIMDKLIDMDNIKFMEHLLTSDNLSSNDKLLIEYNIDKYKSKINNTDKQIERLKSSKNGEIIILNNEHQRKIAK